LLYIRKPVHYYSGCDKTPSHSLRNSCSTAFLQHIVIIKYYQQVIYSRGVFISSFLQEAATAYLLAQPAAIAKHHSRLQACVDCFGYMPQIILFLTSKVTDGLMEFHNAVFELLLKMLRQNTHHLIAYPTSKVCDLPVLLCFLHNFRAIRLLRFTFKFA